LKPWTGLTPWMASQHFEVMTKHQRSHGDSHHVGDGTVAGLNNYSRKRP